MNILEKGCEFKADQNIVLILIKRNAKQKIFFVVITEFEFFFCSRSFNNNFIETDFASRSHLAAKFQKNNNDKFEWFFETEIYN